MTHLLVIGGASTDILHFSGQSIETAGGAGMYTAMAAQRSGVEVSLFGPRPDPIPEQLRPVAGLLVNWLGPQIPVENLPHFEISYEGGRTTYLNFQIDAEAALSAASLPGNLSHYTLAHVTPLGDAENQLRFIRACRDFGVKRISAGTGLMNAADQPDAVRAAFEASDYCFMNAEEAETLFGSVDVIKTIPGKVFFVTLGAQGALVVQGNYVTEVPAVKSQVLDPTGAGDTFCGAATAHLINGHHPIIAAQKATALAAEMIEHPGPSALLQAAPPPGNKDDRAVVDENQVHAIAQMLAAEPEATPFDFTGPDLPAVGDPHTLNWFFVATLHQFSFWTTKNKRYHLPLIDTIDGEKLKGSDYLWRAYLRMLRDDPEYFTAQRQAALSLDDMQRLFRADDGSQPMPALELHLEQAVSYGRDMIARNWTPQRIIDEAQESDTPLRSFIDIMDHIGGYKEDPLRKKSSLLAVILNQRPEKLFTFGASEEVTPVIDYHAMRACLRIGLVNIQDSKLREKIVNREVILPAEEQAIRYASYDAINQVTEISGKSIGAVDWWFFNSRKRCPEMTEPDCNHCQVDPICMHEKDLFQPVLRTTNY